MGCYMNGLPVNGSFTTPEACRADGGIWKDPEEHQAWMDWMGDLARIQSVFNENVYTTTVDFRTEIMQYTTVGQYLMRIYATHGPEAIRLARQDFRLMLRGVEAWLSLSIFADRMLTISRSKSFARSVNALRFPRQTFESVAYVCGQLASRSGNKEFRKALRAVEVEVKRCVGLTPAKVLRAFREKR